MVAFGSPPTLAPLPHRAELLFLRTAFTHGEDVADIAVVAIGSVEAVAASDKALEFALESGELLSSSAKFGELRFEECLDTGAGGRRGCR
jgi:hypothetical protein